MSLEVRIRKRLGRHFVLNVDFRSDGCLGILGPSGCGKSMTLKCIAGIETPDSGRILLNGRVLFDSAAGINLRPQARRVGYLFQNYALFPKMTVRGNIRIGMGRGERAGDACARLVRQFQLEGLEDRYPDQLSGGQQQRTALARMLATNPEILLLDEPFSALDTYLREQMQVMVRGLVERHGDVVLVTHSRDEAYQLCSDLVVLDDGAILGAGETKALFRNPRHVRVARLTGCKNISPIRRLGERRLYAVDWDLELETAAPIADNVRYAGIRAHDFVVDPPPGLAGNVVRLGNARLVEDPFENIVIFTNGDAGNGSAARELWWKYSKYVDIGPVDRLYIPPSEILLLEG